MKIGYIICKASGWYWTAFNESYGRFSDSQYTIYEKRQLAIDKLEVAFDCPNGQSNLEVKKIFYK